MMRITLDLPEDISEVVQSVAAAEGVSLGEAVADLIRRGLMTGHVLVDHRLPSFAVAPTEPPITLEHTLAIEDNV